ncbi:hypothetical protein K493DRAFT_388614 [Basidiobolus meristosporus CBS 931.73]|uniref:Arrestin-like N-terminal domain-containing protein n=1 Tax=Basidiobolus meristosporus CBS 931.73 TaxID=1314790 RepID=A0A1Y1XA25_9FUNG|nr:hypothetical protein K493DRAFT_388614 [Basidiobolus meristosporus CBS 931.73]|eukprot:ORX82579.1 hypothetical protein K493DRAFT_388614 [Basidiobolus meristosporus CBS 931.73]
MWSSNAISLQLQSDNIVLLGTCESASGQVLRGAVTLNIHSRTKISSISMTFQGVASTMNSKQENDVFFQKEFEFLRAVEETKEFLPGQYKYHFEIPLPGDLPESIHSSLSHIRYTATTIAKRGGLAKNLKDKKEVNVQRLSRNASASEQQSLVRFGELESELMFCIFASSTSYHPGTDIPIKVGIKSLKPNSRISKVYASLHEVIKCPTQDGKMKCKATKIRETVSNWNTEIHGGMWIQPMVLLANKRSKRIHANRHNHYVSVHHELTVTITLHQPENIRKRVMIRTSLRFVAAETVEIANSLPCYEQSLEDPPCYDSVTVYPQQFLQ